MKRIVSQYNPNGNEPPNRNNYSVDGSMRNYSEAGLELYRQHFIAYSKAHNRNQRIVSLIENMSLSDYFVYCGAMRVRK